jgi:hypothetical protein
MDASHTGTELDNWTVLLSTSAKRKIKKLPKNVEKVYLLLLMELKKEGPLRANWPHYGPLSKKKGSIPENAHHCHIKGGKPTYVACWAVQDKKIKIMEIFYVGTHENAPY